MRHYIPATTADLLAGTPLRRAASAVTPALRAALPGEDDEGLEFSAFLTAADLSTLEIAASDAAPRRVVLAAEISDPRPVSPAPQDVAELPSVLGVVDLDWADVVAIHLDDDDDATAALVRRALQEDEALETLGDIDLLWYDPSELAALQAALRADPASGS